jgi:tetratricopeptide (TPR) repeat protein
MSLEQMVQEGDEAVEALDIGKARLFYESAANLLTMQIEKQEHARIPGLIKILAKLGETKVSLGDQEGAREDFMRALSLLNNCSKEEQESLEQMESQSSLYLYVGQLSSEEEALQAYQRGVKLLEACVAKLEKQAGDSNTFDTKTGQEHSLSELRMQLCKAYCTIAELYLTDLCFADNAEQECEAAVQKAMQIVDQTDGKPIVDALQALTSLRISQHRASEAAGHIMDVYEKIKTGCEALAALVGLGKNQVNAASDDDEDINSRSAIELVEVEAANSLPGFEFRIQTARLLLECSTVDCRCAEAAIRVLGSLLSENDEVIEAWYLTGCAFATLNPPNNEVAGFYWERALEMLLKVKEGLELDCDDDDETELDGVKSQIEEIQTKLKDVGFFHDQDIEMR